MTTRADRLLTGRPSLVRIDVDADGAIVRCELIGAARRSVQRWPIPVSTARRLQASGVPTVTRRLP
jgi:hypothetical protein